MAPVASSLVHPVQPVWPPLSLYWASLRTIGRAKFAGMACDMGVQWIRGGMRRATGPHSNVPFGHRATRCPCQCLSPPCAASSVVSWTMFAPIATLISGAKRTTTAMM